MLTTFPLLETIRWLKAHQLEGGFAFIGLFCVWITLGLPSTVFELTSGFLFPIWLAIMLSTTGKNMGNSLSFAIGRYMGSDYVQSKLDSSNMSVLRGLNSAIRAQPL